MMRSLRFSLLCCALAAACQSASRGGNIEVGNTTGLSWPSSQAFPSFAPLADLDVIDSAGRPADEQTLIVTLEGLVNRTQPRIYVLDGGEGKRFWLDQLGVTTRDVADSFALITKYLGEIAGIAIYDPAQPDTINLATTIAGLQGGVVASPALAQRLTTAPFALPVLADLRNNHFASKLDVYQYELDHYAATATHRLIIGLNPGIAGTLRDYAVATRAMTVWLDPRQSAEQQLLSRFLRLLPPNSPYLGWWADEPSGVRAASGFGVPVYAADFSCNLTVLGGAPRGSAPVAPPPPAPPLRNKVYVAIFMSDGDNLQEDQHLVPLKWADARRGSVPIGWTIDPALVDVAPSLLRYYQRTATPNDVLVSGPSGLGYTYPAAWPAGAFDSYARLTGGYLAAAGLRVITVWNNGVDLSDASAASYVNADPDLLGLTIQDESRPLRMIGSRVPVIRLARSYASNEADLASGIDGAVRSWSRSAPLFVAVQGNMNSGAIHPTAFYNVQQRFAGNTDVVFLRPDHFFTLLRRANLPRQHQVFPGDFNGDGTSDLLVYDAGDDTWSMGLSDGNALAWHPAGATRGFGYLLEPGHRMWTGDFDGDGKTDVLMFYAGDGNWWLGSSDGNQLTWQIVSNTRGFGNVIDSASHQVVTGDFNGDGKTDVLFYYNGDGNLWLGLSSGSGLAWHQAGNIAGFGNLLDGKHRIVAGDFNGDGKTDLAFYYSGDGAWWLGVSDGNALAWHQAASVKGFGDLLDANHQLLSGDFNGDGKTDAAFYNQGDGQIWLGLSDGNQLAWHVGGNAAGFGSLIDPSHRLFTGDFNGDGKTDVAFYYSGDGTWWLASSDGNALTWHNAGSVSGFGNLLDPSRLLLTGDFNGDRRTDALFYYSGDGNWWLGASGGDQLTWHLAGNTQTFDDLNR
jgi:hypothetical protein